MKIRDYRIYVAIIAIILVVIFYRVWPMFTIFTESPNENKLYFKTVARGSNAQYDNFATLIIQNENEFSLLWQRIYSGFIPLPETPEIDFNNKTVVAIFLGTKPIGGYGVEIIDVIDKSDHILVIYKTSRPGEGTAAAVEEQPYHIIEIGKISKVVMFEER